MMAALEIESLVAQLRRVGLRPPERLVEQILATGQAAVAPLLELATNRELLQGAARQLLGPLHALRLLGELRQPALARPLLNMLPLNLEEFDPNQRLLTLWVEELPQIIARLGPEVQDDLWSIAEDLEQPAPRRDSAIGALGYLADLNPELREPITSRLRALFAGEANARVAATIVVALGMLRVTEAYQEVLAAFRAKRIDTSVITAGAARQLLLGQQREPGTTCAAHELWERYEHHGPTPEDQPE